MKLWKISVLLFVFLSIPAFSYAQVSDIQALQQALTVTTSPNYPEPDQQVEISIQSYTYDLNSATISWTLDGKTIAQGIGVKNASFITGAVGKTQTIDVAIVTADGKTFSKEIPITPSDLTFLTEAETYKPPLYEGKGVFTGESAALIVAMPQIGPGYTDPTKLIYTWTLNGSLLDDASGYGKQSLAMSGSYWGTDDVVEVSVSTVGGETVADNKITLSPQSPQLLVYENNPLLGLLYNNAETGTFALKSGSEASFFAAPFGFIPALLSKHTIYKWSMNGSGVNGGSGNTMTFRNDSGNGGVSVISVKAEQPDASFQSAITDFSIQF